MGLILTAAGGLGIFLLAMSMMTGGLKVFGGERLKQILKSWTSSPLRGIATGALFTALVQSSAVVTIATIGFVNAGVLSLRRSLGVIFGANLGTTMTGWLVSLVGVGFKVEAFALPLIALGVALRIAVSNKRVNGLGEAIAGFGLFFLGLAILRDAFADVAGVFGTATLAGAGAGIGGIALFALVGFAATVATQSSSAAIALILTAASQSALGFGAAAAAIIGANIGSTSTAAFAVIGATPNARRVAAGHILFNLVTAAVALAILPVLLWATAEIGELLGLSGRPTVVLALFHTVFNAVGVSLMLPLVGPLTRLLQRHFTTAEEDIGRPRHLDRTVAATPAFAMPALEQELLRMQDLVCGTGLGAIAGQESRTGVIERRAEAIRQLGRATAAFAVEVRMEGMSREHAEVLARLLRIARYLDEAALLLSALHTAAVTGRRLGDETTRSSLLDLLAAAQVCLAACTEDFDAAEKAARIEAAHSDFEARYQQAKATALRAAVTHRLSIEGADRLLDAMSSTRRMVDQVIKATLMLLAEDAEETFAQTAQPHPAVTTGDNPAASAD
jgi:phosphate:Na+ symporter